MIEVKNISMKYENKELFSNVCIDFKNDFYLLEGKNGTGKSTLMELIAGLKTPISGSIDKIKEKILFLGSTGIGSQELSIMENITLLYWMFDTKLADKHLNKIKKELFTNEQFVEKYSKSSLGMTLKVGLSLIYSDISWGLIILDETFSGIDAESVQHVVSELEKKDCPKIIITHQKMEHYFKSYKKIRLTKNGIE